MGTPVLIRIRLLMSFHERLLCFVTYSDSSRSFGQLIQVIETDYVLICSGLILMISRTSSLFRFT